jgi:hypothetical protein
MVPEKKKLSEMVAEMEQQQDRRKEWLANRKDPFTKFLKYSYSQYGNGTLDDIDPKIREIPDQYALGDFIDEFSNLEALKKFKRDFKPLKGEFMIAFSHESISKIEFFILTNYRVIFWQKDKPQSFNLKNIESYDIKKSFGGAKMIFQKTDGDKKIIKSKIVADPTHMNFAVKYSKKEPSE